MPEGKHLLFFIGAIGAFNGIILALYFIFFTRKKNLAATLFGIMLAALSLRIAKAVLVYFDPNLPKLFLQAGLSACLFIGPALYLFVRACVARPTKMPLSWKLQLIIPAVAIAVAGVVYRYADHPEIWSYYFIRTIYTIWGIYILMAGFAMRDVLGKVLSSGSQPYAAKWLTAIYLANATIFICFALALFFRDVCETYYGGAVVFSVVLYGMIFVRMYYGKTNGEFYIAAAAPKKPLNEVTSALARALNDVMLQQEIYKNPNLSIGELAKTISITSHQLSQLLNDSLGKNFTSFVNEYRIEAACEMISANHPYSLESIGYEVGFNSKSTFYAAFRKLTGTTPSLYKEQALKGQKPAFSAD